MENVFAKVGKNIETTNEINNMKYVDSLKSDLIDRMIDSLEDYLNNILTDNKGKKIYCINGDARLTLEAFKVFKEIVYSNDNRVGVIKNTVNLNTDNFRYYFDCKPDELLHYCYYMNEALREQETNKPKTRNRVSFHSNR